MNRLSISGSPVALAMAIALVAVAALPGAAAQSQLNVRSVGEIFVDAQGHASGQNLATSIDEAEGLIEGFSSLALGTEVFSRIRVDGFAQAEKIQGVGSSSLTLRGSNAIVSLHDNINSIVKVHATKPTLVTYSLAPDVFAKQEGAHGGVVRLSHATKGYLGALVAYGAEGAQSRGEVLQVKGNDVLARAHAGTQLVFLAKPVYLSAPAFQDALLEAAAEGSLASQFVTEFEGSDVATSQVDHGSAVGARTVADASGTVSTSIRSAAQPAAVLAYDLAYETLPARSASEVAVYADGQLATRAQTPREVLSFAENGVASFYAVVQNGRTQILASSPDFSASGEHRVVVSVGAQASTESQGRAEQSAEDDARVYGGFEYHANGKLTGHFLTSVVPDGRAQLLSFTALASRTEIFRSVSVDGAAAAKFEAGDDGQMLLQTPKADLTLVDDVHATMLLAAKAPADAAYELAAGISARAEGQDIIHLQGPYGPAGALVLAGEESAKEGSALGIDANGAVRARLAPGATLVYRGAPDAHPSEPAVLRALAAGDVGAQLLAGLHAGALATKAASYHEDVRASIRPEGYGGLVVDYLANDDAAPRAFVLDARGASIAAKAASDIRVMVDGHPAVPVFTPEEALDVLGVPRYYAMTSLDGALRVIVNTASAAGQTTSVTIESAVQGAAQAQAHTDAFGQFKLFHDGTAVGNFVTLKAHRTAGAVSGFTMIATQQPIFASVAAGSSSFVSTGSDGASVLKLENRESRLEFSDTTNGFAKIVAVSDTEAAFRLAADLRAQQRSSQVVELIDGGGNHVGSLILAGAAGASALEQRGEGEIRARLAQGAEVLFRTHAGIEAELSGAQRTMMNQAIASGRVAGQVLVQTQANLEADFAHLERTARTESEGLAESLAIAAHQAYGEVTSAVSASYGDMQVLTAATKNRVDITVASTASLGKTLIVSLDPDTIPGMAAGKANIRFDGEFVGQASSYADILDANDDGGVAEYFVLAGEAGTQVLVSIPHFSVHTVTLEQQPASHNTLYMYATVFLGLLVVVESALLARGHRSGKKNKRA